MMPTTPKKMTLDDPLTAIGGGRSPFLRYEMTAELGSRRAKREEEAREKRDATIREIERVNREKAKTAESQRRFRAEVDVILAELDGQQQGGTVMTARAKRAAAALARANKAAGDDSIVTDEQLYGEAPNILLGMTGGGASLSAYLQEVLRAPTLERGQTYSQYLDALASRSRVAEITLSRLEDKRRIWVKRFEVVGHFFWNKLRYCTWKISLRAGFEALPSTVGGGHVDGGYMVPIERFQSVVANSISLDLTRVTPSELALWSELVFELLDVELTGAIDYREFTALTAFFRLETHADVPAMMTSLYRAYEGDMTRGLATRDLLRVLCFFCISPSEVQGVLELCDWNALVDDSDAPKVKYVLNVLGELVKEGPTPEEVAAKARADADMAAEAIARRPVKLLAARRERLAQGDELFACLSILNQDVYAHRYYNAAARKRIMRTRMLFVLRRGEGEERIELRWLRERKEAEEAARRAEEEFEARLAAEEAQAEEQRALQMLSILEAGGTVSADAEAMVPAPSKGGTAGADLGRSGEDGAPSSFFVMRMKAVGGYNVTRKWHEDNADAVITLPRGMYRYQRIMPAPADDAHDAPWNRGNDTLSAIRFFGNIPNDKARHPGRSILTKGTAFQKLGPRGQGLRSRMVRLSQGAAFNLLGPWEQYMVSKTGKTMVPACLPVLPVPSVIEKFGLPNPVDAMQENERAQIVLAQIDAQRVIDEQIKAAARISAGQSLIEAEGSGDNDGDLANFGWANGGDEGVEDEDASVEKVLAQANSAVAREAAAAAAVAGEFNAELERIVKEAKDEDKAAAPSFHDSRRKNLFEKPPPFDPLAPFPLPKYFKAPRPPMAPYRVIGPFNYYPANTRRPPIRWTLASVPGFSEGMPFPVTSKACGISPAAALRARVAARDKFLARPRKSASMVSAITVPVAPGAVAADGSAGAALVPTLALGSLSGAAAAGGIRIPAIALNPAPAAELDMLEKVVGNPLLPNGPGEEASVGDPLSEVLAMCGRCKAAEPFERAQAGQSIGGTTVVVSIPASFKRADFPRLLRFIKACPGLSTELMRLRLLRMVPAERALYLSETIRDQARRSALVRQTLFDETSAVLALENFRLRTEAKFFQAWLGVARAQIWERVRINSLRARRAVRALVLYSRAQRIEAARTVRAETFYAFSFFRKFFLAWRSAATLLREEYAAGVARADALRKVHDVARVFTGWRSLTVNARAVMHHAAVMCKKFFHQWAFFTARARARRISNAIIDAMIEGRRLGVGELTAEWEAKRIAALELEAYIAESTEFSRLAANSVAEQEAAATEAAAASAAADAAKKQSQVALRRETAEAERGRVEKAFKDEWNNRIDGDLEKLRIAHGAWLESQESDAETVLLDIVAQLRSARTVEEASARESAFGVEIASDGSFHFICSVDSKAISKVHPHGRPALDFNRDKMSEADARIIAREHSLGVTIAARRDQLVAAMRIDSDALLAGFAARKLQKAFRSRRNWRAFCRRALAETEVFCNATGGIFYAHAPTGRTSSKPWKFLRSLPPPSPVPEYFVRPDSDSPSALIDAGG
jgi:hypothetical protein